MYRLRSFWSRKPLRDCSADHRARRIRLIKRARVDYLAQSNSAPDHSALNDHDASLVGDDVLSVAPPSPSSSLHSSNENHDRDIVNDNSVRFDSDSDVESNDSVANESSVMNDCDSIVLPPPENVEIFEEKLRRVFAEENMTHKQIKSVLQVIKTHACFSSMHRDSRTIMKTPVYSMYPIHQVAGGEYLHLGVRDSLLKFLSSIPQSTHPGTLEIDFSTDEASLDKNSKILMWPIQIRVPNIPNSDPLIIGVFKNSTKPSNALLFFKPFVDEMRELLQSGLNYENKNIPLRLRCFIADAPARAFSLGHRGHNSRVPCSRCWIRGECYRAGVMVYKGTTHKLRTEEEYASMIDTEHHNCIECPLASLGFNVVVGTVFDYMHLVCLGIMEKILQGIIDGRFAKSAKIESKNHMQALNVRLEVVKMYCPRDFARKPIKIEKHGKFKATEQRQLLLYSGPIIFYGLVNDAVYNHFLLLTTAMRILVDPEHTAESVNFAEDCIRIFNETCTDVYGVEFLSYNVHALLHLPDDVRSFGPLDSFSAFPYENNMTYCRKMCRKPSQHLQQISNRHAENCHTQSRVSVDPSTLKFIGKHAQGPTPPIDDENYSQYCKVFTGSICLSKLRQDSTIFLRNGTIATIKNIIQRGNSCYLLLQAFTKIDDLFNLPCLSSCIGIYLCSLPSSELMYVSLDQVASKCFVMPYWSKEDCNTETFAVIKILSTQIAK